jgi:hypothetical protein
MKKIILSALLSLSVASAIAAVTKVPVQGEITSNTTWTNDKQYVLNGFVYVTSGNTLTIDPGTIIRGDKNTKGTLIIERGAKIVANGSDAQPIIFTSNEEQGSRSYGDWGGIIICGNAPTNWTAGEAQVEGGPRSKYGGSDAADNSGKLSYVRIEFGGIAFSPNNEVNGLTLAGVGSGTQLDHIQVSFSGDDAYEWFGGTVNAKYLIAFRSWDDDFDADVQYDGKNQFCFVQRAPYSADVSGSKAFETDSYLSGTASGLPNDWQKATKTVFSNVTLVGPVETPTSTNYDALQHTAGVHIRRGSSLSLLNSVIIGFPAGILIDESSSAYGSTVYNLQNDHAQLRNNIIAGIPTNGSMKKEIVYVKDGARNLTPTNTFADTTSGAPFAPFAGPISWLTNSAWGNRIYATAQNGVRLQDAFNPTNPNPVPTSTSPINYNSKALPAYIPAGTFPGNVYPFNPAKPINTDTSGLFANYNAPDVAPDFTNSKANDGFFDKVNYVGAFAGTGNTSDNWMKGWANFDPNNTFYEYTLSVEDVNVNNANALTVYPNPAQSTATIVYSPVKAADLNVTIVDMAGRVVKNVFNGKNISTAQSFNVDVNDLNNGLYLVVVTAGNTKQTARLSIAK